MCLLVLINITSWLHFKFRFKIAHEVLSFKRTSSLLDFMKNMAGHPVLKLQFSNCYIFGETACN